MANRDFELVFGARLDESNIKTQVQRATNDLSKIATVKTKLQIDTSSLKEIKTELSTIQKTIDNYNNNSAQSFNKMAKAVQIVKTETDKYRLSNDGLRTVITKTNEAGQKFRTIVDEVTTAEGKLVKTTQNLVQEQNGNLKYWKQQGETIKDITADYAKATDETNILKDKIAQLNKVEEQNVTSTQNMGVAMRETSNHAVTLGQRIVDATEKVALFRLATTPISILYDTINEAKDAVLEFDKTLTEFKKVSDLSGESLDEYTKKLGTLGETVARTRSEMLSASQEFVKSGFGEEQAAELAQVSEMFRNVVDEEISSAESAGFLVSMMKAYDDESTEFAEHVANAVDNVSNNMAVSSADIQSGLSKVASAFATTGNSVEQSIALITSATETMHGQANKVSRGWRSASATLSKMAESAGELSYSVNGVQKTISLLDETTGDFIGTYATMQKIYEEGWKQMSNLEKANLALQIGNKTQMEVILSTLNNFEGAEKALNLAIEDNNAAWKENERYMESVEAQLNLVKSQFSNFILGDGGLQKATISLLKFANGLLNIINSLGGLKTIIIALMGLAITTKLNSIIHGVDLFKTTIGELTSKLGLLLVAAIQDENGFKGLAKSFIETKSSAELAQLAVGGFFAVLTAGIAIFSLVNSAIEKHNQAIKTARDNAIANAQSIESEISALDDLKSKIQNEDLTREQLNSLLEQNIDGYDSEKDALDEVTDARQRAIDKIDEERAKKAQAWLDENKTQALSDQENLGSFSGKDIGEKWYQNLSNWSRGVGITPNDSDIDALHKYQDAIDELNGRYETLSWSEKNYLEHIQEQRNELYNNISVEEENTATMLYMQAVVDGTSDSLNAYNEFCKNSETQQGKVVESTESVAKTLKDIENEYGYSKDALLEYIEANSDLYESLPTTSEGWLSVAAAMREEGVAVGELSDGLQSFTDYVSNVSDAYGILSNAVDEYNETGGYSLETLNKLIPLMAQYGQMFDIVDGQIIIHTEDMYSLIEAEAEEQKSVIRGTAIAKLNALEQENSGKKAKESGDKHKEATAGIDENTASLNENTEAAVKNAQAQALQRGASKDDVENIIKEMQANIDLIDKAVAGMNTSFVDSTKKAAKRASGSHKSAAKESKDAWLEAYKAEKDTVDSMYKTSVLSAEEYAAKLKELSDKYLTDSAEHQEKYAKEIHSIYEEMYKALQKSLKEALDEEEKRLKKSLDDIKDQKSERIKAVKRENEEALKGVKKQIDALKDEKKAVKDSYDARIDALKSERKEYERQVALMKAKQELAKAEHTFNMVMGASGRFEWLQDQEAVDQAREDALEEEKKQQYERELEALEKARDDAEALYEKRIDDLEKYYDAEKERRDKALDDLEDAFDKEIQARENAYNTFKEQANKWLDGQYQVMADENTTYGQRLANLKSFVDSYNAMLATLGKAGATASNNYSGNTTKNTKGVSGGSSSKKGTSSTYYNYKTGKQVAKPHATTKSIAKTRASGDAYTEDGAYIVGENPNQEIVLGSKLNNGVMMNLSKGSGVVNAKSTRTLAGLLNSLNPNGLGKVFNPNTTNNNTSNSITISNVSLPNVKDGADFISYLQNFDVDMLQRAY